MSPYLFTSTAILLLIARLFDCMFILGTAIQFHTMYKLLKPAKTRQ